MPRTVDKRGETHTNEMARSAGVGSRQLAAARRRQKATAPISRFASLEVYLYAAMSAELNIREPGTTVLIQRRPLRLGSTIQFCRHPISCSPRAMPIKLRL
jgi:hypothetical protein